MGMPTGGNSGLAEIQDSWPLSNRGARKTTLRWHLVMEASCFCTVHERTRGDGGWNGGERKEKAARTKIGGFVLGPARTFLRFLHV